MEYIKGTTEFGIKEECVISLGKFDGLHRGHELLLTNMMEKKNKGLAAVLFTFDIPPRPNELNTVQKVLTTNDEKVAICRRHGIDYLIECPFTPEIMNMEPEDFIQMLVKSLHVKCVVAGTDFRFGHNRRGDYRLLENYAGAMGYEVIVVDKMQCEGRDISSTFVREEVLKGDMEKTKYLLGYDYFVYGKVEHGRHMGSTVLGIPTINVIPPKNKLLPPYGVYVCEIVIGTMVYEGIANIGCKPTIEGQHPIGVEAHIFDFAEDVYGREVQILFKTHVRDEMKFASIHALKVQMEQDIAFGRHYFCLH